MRTERRYEIKMPDLGLGSASVRAGSWLARRGSSVEPGNGLLELIADHVVVEVAAEVSGTLVKKFVAEDDVVSPGQTLGVIELHE